MSRIAQHRPAPQLCRRGLARLAAATLVAGLALLPGIATPAGAATVEDYIAARDKLAAEIAGAVRAGESEDAVDRRNAAAVKDLQARMEALLGPVLFPGTQSTPIFLPTTLIPEFLESQQPDGLLFSSDDYLTRVFISPEPVFLNWLGNRGKAPDAPAALRSGMGDAMGSGPLYNAVMGADAAFVKYMDLPVAAGTGESVNAALGLFTQTGAQNDAPNTIVFTRVADGRVVVGATEVKEDIPPFPACDKIWDSFEDKAKALIVAAEKSKNDQDPRWQESTKVEEEGAAAYRACFVKEAPAQPFFQEATKRAQELLATARGK